MIDLSPSDLSCIYSTMQFVCDQASRYESIPILTFDQPLYWKSFQIRANENEHSLIKKMVLRLGGFHMCMSYLGAVGQIMHGSGLQEFLELVYASNLVPYILCGKSYSRAVRAHMLLDTALYTLMLSKATDNSDGDSQGDFAPPSSSSSLYDRLLKGEDVLDRICQDDEIDTICSESAEYVTRCFANGRTATLWGQYLEMVDILKTFITAEYWKLATSFGNSCQNAPIFSSSRSQFVP